MTKYLCGIQPIIILFQIRLQTRDLTPCSRKQHSTTGPQHRFCLMVGVFNAALQVLTPLQKRQILGGIDHNVMYRPILRKSRTEHSTALRKDSFRKQRKHAAGGAGTPQLIVMALGGIDLCFMCGFPPLKQHGACACAAAAAYTERSIDFRIKKALCIRHHADAANRACLRAPSAPTAINLF